MIWGFLGPGGDGEVVIMVVTLVVYVGGVLSTVVVEYYFGLRVMLSTYLCG